MDKHSNPHSANNVTPFALPVMEGMVVTDSGAVPNVRVPTVQRLEELQQQAYEEGYAAGHALGLDNGSAEIAAKTAQVAGIVEALAAPLQHMDNEVLESLTDLAVLIARHLVRRELKLDPSEIVAVVREAVGHLPVAARNPQLRMHPEDIELIRNALSIDEDAKGWKLQPDPLVTRGGCIVETDSSRIDATVESRLSAIVTQMLADERAIGRDD